MQLSVIVYQSHVCIYEALIGVISGTLILPHELILVCSFALNNVKRILYFIQEWKTNFNLFSGMIFVVVVVVRNHVYNRYI